MNNDTYRQVILDHYKYPHNKIIKEPEGYLKREGVNPACGDHVTIFLKFDDEQIVDIKFIGEGCSICCASASVMTLELNKLTKNEILIKIEKFEEIIKNADESNFNDFEDGQAFVGISSYPARFTCAHISWETVRKLIEELEE